MSNLQVPVTADDHIFGNLEAPITLLEYGDFQCPHCAAAHSVIKQLQQHFGDRVSYVYRNFPLTEIYPLAEPAAEAAEFAGAKGKYWFMHDSIYDNQRSLSPELLVNLAVRLQFDSDELATAIGEQRYLRRITRDVEAGERAGVHATPTFFINGRQYLGPSTFEKLAASMETAKPAYLHG